MNIEKQFVESISVMLKKRRARLIPFFEKYALDAIFITDLKNIRYLSGFSGTDGVLLLTPDNAWFLCDSRYTFQASTEVADAVCIEYTAKFEAVCRLVVEHEFKRVGFEAANMFFSDYRQLAERLSGYELVAIGAELAAIRSCKDSSELELLREVAELASASLNTVLAFCRPGMTESDLSRELEFEMRRRGADSRAFDFIVASGERGAMPHGRASNKVIRSGEMLTIDFGALRYGYHSDETVTVAFGQPDARSQEVHSIVREAHDRAIAAIRPGLNCQELDAIARNFIHEQGYGKYFGHGLGHGVGLDVHELPVLSPRSTAVLAEGMVVTIEPGIYLPGFGGVRIEDTVAVTANGSVMLTQAPKELLSL